VLWHFVRVKLLNLVRVEVRDPRASCLAVNDQMFILLAFHAACVSELLLTKLKSDGTHLQKRVHS
jgi:hypothetical protein